VRFPPDVSFDEPRPRGITLTALILVALCIPGSQVIASQFGAENRLGMLAAAPVLAFELFALWKYWNGSEWARVLVLAVSLLNVAGALSSLFERNAGMLRLMGDPLRVFQLAVACFLLYYLNTRPVRVWFSHAPSSADLVSQQLEGRLCTMVRLSGEKEWVLSFEHDAELTLECPWRLMMDDNMAFASISEQEASVDEAEPRRLLQNLRVKSMRVPPGSSDLVLDFEMGIELQTWSEGPQSRWEYSDQSLIVTADSVTMKPGSSDGDSGAAPS
jgi:hypothetical protein